MFSRPYGTERNSHRLPATEVAGYFRPVPTGPVGTHQSITLLPIVLTGCMCNEVNPHKIQIVRFRFGTESLPPRSRRLGAEDFRRSRRLDDEQIYRMLE